LQVIRKLQFLYFLSWGVILSYALLRISDQEGQNYNPSTYKLFQKND